MATPLQIWNNLKRGKFSIVDDDTKKPMKVGVDGEMFSANDLIEIAKGKVTGASLASITCVNPNVGTSFEDIWDAGGSLIYPSAAGEWEILSDDVADASAGTGLKTVKITTLDGDYIVQTQTVTLNGTTPVSLTGTHLRPRIMISVTAGSANENVGTIILREKSSGNTMLQMRPTLNTTFSGHFTIPAGKTALVFQTYVSMSKGADIILDNRCRFVGSEIFISTGENSSYQASFTTNNIARAPIPEKSDLRTRCKSTNPDVSVTAKLDILLFDEIFTNDLAQIFF